jgi:hypothetical protein
MVKILDSEDNYENPQDNLVKIYKSPVKADYIKREGEVKSVRNKTDEPNHIKKEGEIQSAEGEVKNIKNKTDDEPNYIKKEGESQSAEGEQNAKKNIYAKLKDEIHKHSDHLKECQNSIHPKRKQERELDRETGGLEVDYEKIQKKNNEDKDVWDKDFKEENAAFAPPQAADDDLLEASAYESFIHRKKRRRGKNGKMGKMKLDSNNDADPNSKDPNKPRVDEDGKPRKKTFVEKVNSWSLNKEKGGGISF